MYFSMSSYNLENLTKKRSINQNNYRRQKRELFPIFLTLVHEENTKQCYRVKQRRYRFGFICSLLLGERINPTGYCPIDKGFQGTYGLTSLSEKTRKAHHLLMSMQRQPFLLNYFKTLSRGPTRA